MLDNSVKEKIRKGEPSVGVISNLASTQLTEIFGLAGFEFIIFDMEHSTMSEETLEDLVRAAKLKKLVPLARVRENNAKLVLGALDAGCLGVMIPQIETKEQAQQAALSTKYRPHGNRGINWKVVASEWGDVNPAEYISAANANILTIIQIETAAGVENIEAIVKVQDIDAVVIGPADLSGSMGYPGNPGHKEVQSAVDRVMKVCHAAGMALGVGASLDPAHMSEARQRGALLFFANPAEFIRQNCRALVSGIKAGLAVE
ncbi:MAG: hypothetical protein JSW39_30245 [Desulfobacterales bacterium]|nr:MAG: hypothetical protein JSW39_30245 [Desulfobacterales bacterium]